MVRRIAYLELAAILAAATFTAATAACAAPGRSARIEVRFPALPDAWREVLGECEWSLRWTGVDGEARRLDGCRTGTRVELSPDDASAVLAYPYWPRRRIEAGIVRPAGAVYPFDGNEDEAFLDWRGGPVAFFFRELDAAEGEGRTRPERFDWPRFRELLSGDSVRAEVRADPWVVDWRYVAEKTRASGFDRRRLVPRDTETVAFTSPATGPWTAASPFAASPEWKAGEAAAVAASGEGEAYLCSAGTLRCAAGLVAWFPAPEE